MSLIFTILFLFRANFGIFCSTPGIPLIRNVPRKVAAHMLFTGLPISAQEAYQAGLVSKIVTTDMLGELSMIFLPPPPPSLPLLKTV